MAYVLVVVTRFYNRAVTVTPIPGFATEASAITAGTKLQDTLTTQELFVTYTVVAQ